MLLSGCGSGGKSKSSGSSSSSSSSSGSLPAGVSVSGSFGSKPSITIKSPLKVTTSSTAVVIKGTGNPLLSGKQYLIHLTLADGRTGKTVISTYDNHDPVPVIPNLKVRGDKVVDYKKDAPAGEGFDKIDSGIYVMKKSLVEGEKRERFMLADLWPPLIAIGKLGAFEVRERFYDIGTPDRLKEFEEKVRDYFPNPVSDQLPGRRH